jgi:hypothetical protein
MTAFRKEDLLFRLAPDRGRCRVLDLQPVIDPTGAVGRAEALRHDALDRPVSARLQTHSSNERAPRRLAARVIDTAFAQARLPWSIASRPPKIDTVGLRPLHPPKVVEVFLESQP